MIPTHSDLVVPETLPISATDTCYNGGINDGCGARVEIVDGVALCPRCGVYQRYVAASAEFIESVTGRRNVVSFAAQAGKVE